jgi:hypothetical protein
MYLAFSYHIFLYDKMIKYYMEKERIENKSSQKSFEEENNTCFLKNTEGLKTEEVQKELTTFQG